MKHASNLLLAAGLSLLAVLPAQAALTRMTGNGGNLGNGSLSFLAVDSVDVTSVIVDLGYFYTDAVGTAFNTPGTTIQWNFGTNALSVNGVAQGGTYNWSQPYANFASAALAANTKWAVISGALGSYPDYFVTTGNPTPTQIASQTVDLTANMVAVDAMYGQSNNVVTGSGRVTTQQLQGYGANSVVNATRAQDGYVAAGGNFGSNGNWQNNLRWSATVPAGAANTSGFWSLNDDVDGAVPLAGVFSYNAGVLTYTTAPVPEAEAGLLAAAGASVLWFARRRRSRA